MDYSECLKKLNSICNYVVLKEDEIEKKIIILTMSEISKKIKKSFKEFEKKFDTKFYFVTKNNGFLDNKWECNILNSRIEKKGVYYPNLENQFFLEIYLEEIYEPIFRYSQKNNLNVLANLYYSSSKKYTYRKLILKLKKFMEEKNYSFICTKYKWAYYNKNYDKQFIYFSKLQKILKNYTYYNKKIPGFLSKICFTFLKKYNHLKIKFKKNKNGNLQEFNKHKSTNGCLYFYKYENNTKISFVKCMDYFKTYINEIESLTLLKDCENDFYPKLISFDKKFYVEESIVNGITLREYLNKYKLNSQDSKKIIEFLIKILDDLYARNIIHRDIRPQNIMVSTINGKINNLYLIDFGFSINPKIKDLNYNNLFDKRVLKALGDNYKPSLYEYDDAISCVNMLEDIISDVYDKYSNEVEKIISKIGRLKVNSERK